MNSNFIRWIFNKRSRAILWFSLAGLLFWFGSRETTALSTTASLAAVTQLLKPTATPTHAMTVVAKGSATPTATRVLSTATPSPVPLVAPVTYRVKSGEMLLGIAAKFAISAEVIMMVNEITDPTTLQIGQELLIPVTPTPALKITPTPSPTLVFHNLEAGDTLLALAFQYNTSVEALMEANWLTDPTTLQIGQKLLIPSENGALPDPILWASTIRHTVEAGDTLLQLAGDYGSTLEDILAVNPQLDPDFLQLGQELVVPLTRPRGKPQSSPTAAKVIAPSSLSVADVAALKADSPSLVGLEQAMIEAVNAQRQTLDLPALAVDQTLTLLAWGHAHDMLNRGYFGHATPAGMTLRDRFEAQQLPTVWVGENIYLSVKPASQAVGAAVGWFMNDAPHRQNILHPRFTRLGVGVAQQPTGWYIFVLDFAGD